MLCKDIIKGLECCKNEAACDNCPYCERSCCDYDIKDDACKMLKCQKEEIEKLTKELQFCKGQIEAYKHCIENMGR